MGGGYSSSAKFLRDKEGNCVNLDKETLDHYNCTLKYCFEKEVKGPSANWDGYVDDSGEKICTVRACRLCPVCSCLIEISANCAACRNVQCPECDKWICFRCLNVMKYSGDHECASRKKCVNGHPVCDDPGVQQIDNDMKILYCTS